MLFWSELLRSISVDEECAAGPDPGPTRVVMQTHKKQSAALAVAVKKYHDYRGWLIPGDESAASLGLWSVSESKPWFYTGCDSVRLANPCTAAVSVELLKDLSAIHFRPAGRTLAASFWTLAARHQNVDTAHPQRQSDSVTFLAAWVKTGLEAALWNLVRNTSCVCVSEM